MFYYHYYYYYLKYLAIQLLFELVSTVHSEQTFMFMSAPSVKSNVQTFFFFNLPFCYKSNHKPYIKQYSSINQKYFEQTLI